MGRGTSTFDGMAIARSVVEYTYSKKIGAKTLFATHYHELTDMEEQFPGIVNYNIAAKKRGDSITFLRKIVRGGTNKSFGIEVASLAGLPEEVIIRAREILKTVEQTQINKNIGEITETDNSKQRLANANKIMQVLSDLNVNTLTPLNAFDILVDLKNQLKD